MSEMVKRVAASIRSEIDILLGDYSGDLCNDSIERTPEEQDLADSRLKSLDWLREKWKPDAMFSEERLEGVARAAIEAMREPTDDMIFNGNDAASSENPVAVWDAMIDAAIKS